MRKSNKSNDILISSNKKGLKIFTILALVLLCINPTCFEGENCMNLLLIAFLCLSPAVLLIKGTRVFIPYIDLPLLIVILLVIFLPLIFFPETIRWTTQLFTAANCFFLMMYARLLRISDLSEDGFIRTMKWIVYAFWMLLIVQQLCVLLIDDYVFLGSLIYDVDDPYKLNSWVAESSHLTVVLTIIMIIYALTISSLQPEKSFWKEARTNKWIWLCYAYCIFTTHNSSALIAWIFPLLPFIKRNNFYWYIGVACVAFVILFCSPLKNSWYVERTSDMLVALPTLDDQKIIDADPSGAARIVPSIWGLKSLDPGDIRFYIGHGVDNIHHELPNVPASSDGLSTAGIFNLGYTYGIFCQLSLWVAIWMCCYVKRNWVTIVIFLMGVQLAVDYNMQLVWMLMSFAMTYKYIICGRKNLLQTSLTS